jgi:hypothetical protein
LKRPRRPPWPAAALLALAGLACFADDAPLLRAVEVQGCSAYSREQVLRIVRLDGEKRLLREPSAVAAALEARYHDDGYPAARVQGVLEGGTLTLTVDEGSLAEVEIPALRGPARERALAALALVPGRVVRDLDVEAALGRLEEASRGALVREQPSHEVEATPAGARLVIHVRERRLRPRLRVDRVGTQAIRDRASGWAPRLGAEVTVADLRSYDHTALYGQAAYSVDADTTRFTAGIYRPFAGGRVVSGYEFHDLTDTEDDYRARGIAEAPGSAIAFRTYKDLFGRRGHEAYVVARLSPHWRAGLSFRSDAYTSLPAVTGSAEDPPKPNPPIDEGRMRSLIASLQWSSREGHFDDPREAHRWALLRSLYTRPLAHPPPLALGASFEWASKDLGGDFSFRRLIAEGRSHHLVTARGTLSTRLLVGIARGDVPAQKRFALGGLGTLRGYDEKEFDGEGLLLANVEWAVSLGRLVPSLIPFADAGATWTGARTTDGIRADLGLGLRWPPTGSFFVRVDGATAVTRGGGGLRVTGLVQVPF